MADNIIYKVIDHWSPEYRKAIYVRYKMLRQPLGLKFSREQFEQEYNQIHIVAILDNQIIGNLCFIPFPQKRWRMRQVAVLPQFQGKHIGWRLVRFAEEYALQNNISEIFLHARDYVIPFYLKLGYQVTGEQFTEVGIPHHHMHKVLADIQQIKE